MGQCDDILVSVVYVPEVRNEGKDFGGDLVDWCQPVCPDPNNAENLDSVLLEGVELEHYARQSRSMRLVLLVQPQPCQGSPRTCIVAYQPSDVRYFATVRTYFGSKVISCRIFLVARRCRDIAGPPAEVDMIVDVEIRAVDIGDIDSASSNPAHKLNLNVEAFNRG